MDRKVKITAVISAAVMNYISSEEEMSAMQQAGLQALQSAPGGVQAPLPPFNIWGVSGRQAIMQTRNLMQFKAFIGRR
ncbi:MAG: hypothetical protein EHM30_02025 [Desulfobacteraceae bacterium]|jgi:hypothetical protein|nr:MAG: hypothetical protein EHM30_02025 [Desulfobacteraceae bacterium]